MGIVTKDVQETLNKIGLNVTSSQSDGVNLSVLKTALKTNFQIDYSHGDLYHGLLVYQVLDKYKPYMSSLSDTNRQKIYNRIVMCSNDELREGVVRLNQIQGVLQNYQAVYSSLTPEEQARSGWYKNVEVATDPLSCYMQDGTHLLKSARRAELLREIVQTAQQINQKHAGRVKIDVVKYLNLDVEKLETEAKKFQELPDLLNLAVQFSSVNSTQTSTVGGVQPVVVQNAFNYQKFVDANYEEYPKLRWGIISKSVYSIASINDIPKLDNFNKNGIDPNGAVVLVNYGAQVAQQTGKQHMFPGVPVQKQGGQGGQGQGGQGQGGQGQGGQTTGGGGKPVEQPSPNFLVSTGNWIQKNVFDSLASVMPIKFLGSIIKMIGNCITGLLKTIGYLIDGDFEKAMSEGWGWVKDAVVVGGSAWGIYALGKKFEWWGVDKETENSSTSSNSSSNSSSNNSSSSNSSTNGSASTDNSATTSVSKNTYVSLRHTGIDSNVVGSSTNNSTNSSTNVSELLLRTGTMRSPDDDGTIWTVLADSQKQNM